MKILQVTSTFYPIMGGQEKVVEDLCLMLIKRGHEVDVLTTDMLCKDKCSCEETYKKIKVIRKNNNFYLAGYGFSLEGLNWIKENYHNYDVIHFHGFNRFLSEVPIFFLKNKVPMIFTPHGFVHTQKNSFFKWFHNLFVNLLIGYADFFTSLTKLDIDYYKKISIKEKKVVEIPNAISESFFKRINKIEKDKFRRRFGIKNNEKMLLYTGRIHKSKGIQYIVKSIKNIKCKLLVVGSDSGFKKELEEVIKNENIVEKVIFAGPLYGKDLLNSYQSCDLFVLVSEWEGFGLSVVEAMASEKPVIVSDRGSLLLIVKNNFNGFVVPFKDTKVLEKIIKKVLINNAKISPIRRNAKKTASKYVWKKIINRYEEVYNRAIKNGK